MTTQPRAVRLIALGAITGAVVASTLHGAFVGVPAHAAIAPGPPIQVVATPQNAAATVTWSPPAPNGGAPATSYTVTATGGGPVPPVTVSASPATVTGLQNGVIYTMSVAATNADGTGPGGLSNRVTPGSADALVQVDTGRTPLQPVSSHMFGTGLNWINGDQTADASYPTSDGHYFPATLQTMSDLGLTFLRYPSGTASNCQDWKDGTSLQSNRDQLGPGEPGTPSQGHCIDTLIKDHFGTNQFMTEVNALRQKSGADIEPIITVNMCRITQGTFCGDSNGFPDLCQKPTLPQDVGCPGAVDAAEWVAYLNGDQNSTQLFPTDHTTVGMWATRRANDPQGSAQPYGVHYFEFGNEIDSLGPYSAVFDDYVTAMKAVDPSIIVIANGPCDCGSPTLDESFVTGVMKAEGSHIDYLAPHLYEPDGDTGSFRTPGTPDAVSESLDALQAAIDAAGFHGKIGILPTEWSPQDQVDAAAPKDPDEQARGDVRAMLDQATDVQAFIRHGVAGSVNFSFSSETYQLAHCSQTSDRDADVDCANATPPAPFLSVPGNMLHMLKGAIDPYWADTSSTSNAIRALATVQGSGMHVQLVNLDSTAHSVQLSVAGVTPTGTFSVQTLSGAATALDVCDPADYNQACPGGATLVTPVTMANPPPAAPTVTLSLPALSFNVVAVPLTSPPLSGVNAILDRAPDSNGYYTHPVTATFFPANGFASSCSSPQTYSGPSAFNVVLTGTCTDGTNTVSGSTTPLAYDNVGPTTSIAGFQMASNTVTGGATDDLSGVARTVVTLTNAAGHVTTFNPATCMSGCGTTATTWSVSTAGLLPGPYTVNAYSVDNAGNAGASKSMRVAIT